MSSTAAAAVYSFLHVVSNGLAANCELPHLIVLIPSAGGTSTSTAPGSAAAASGPPGTSFTSTAPGQSYSSSGGRRKLKLSGWTWS
jgi:hypothetical protein